MEHVSWCGTHTPSADRPGEVGRKLHRDFARARYRLALANGGPRPALVEVYPHLALLGLAGQERRLPYKVSKTGTYWPREWPPTRKCCLVEQWRKNLRFLRRSIAGIALPLPTRPEELSFAKLKRFEDALDALVCAWTAIQFLEGATVALGENGSAIWVPNSAMAFAYPAS